MKLVAQDSVQGDHAPQLETLQSCGQACSLQDCTSWMLGQSFSTCSTVALIWRLRVLDPPPQLAEHAPKKPQSAKQKHLMVAHGCSRLSAAHRLPPKALVAVMGRVLRCTPPSHVAEHEPQLPQAPKTQSTGHGSPLQTTASASMGHTVPWNCDCLITLRCRTWWPLPHEAEQLDQLLHAETAQWMGHGPWPQRRTSLSSPHPMPP